MTGRCLGTGPTAYRVGPDAEPAMVPIAEFGGTLRMASDQSNSKRSGECLRIDVATRGDHYDGPSGNEPVVRERCGQRCGSAGLDDDAKCGEGAGHGVERLVVGHCDCSNPVPREGAVRLLTDARSGESIHDGR